MRRYEVVLALFRTWVIAAAITNKWRRTVRNDLVLTDTCRDEIQFDQIPLL